MLKSLYNALLEWNKTTDERQKLQHTFVFITILSVLVAGVVSLIDQQTGENILKVTVVSGVIFIVNAFIWILLDSALLSRLSGRRRR